MIHIEISEADLKALILRRLEEKLGPGFEAKVENLTIEVKSKHNWKAEWEPATFRATYKEYDNKW